VTAASRSAPRRRTLGEPLTARELTVLRLAAAGMGNEEIGARLDRLDFPTRRTLNSGAVCGRTFWVRVLERLLPDVQTQPQLALLEGEGLVILRSVSPEVTYGFRQFLIHQGKYWYRESKRLSQFVWQIQFQKGLLKLRDH